MGDVFHADDLSKLKLSELKKICKENKLSTSGTKVELVARLTEMRVNKFILQPGDEAELLGDDNDGDPNDTNLSSSITLESNENQDSLDVPVVSPSKVSTVKTRKRVMSDGPNAEDQPVTKKVNNSSEKEITEVKMNSIDTTITRSSISDEERLALRAKRFNTASSTGSFTSTNEKFIARAHRFGLPIGNQDDLKKNDCLSDFDALEKLKKRAERFGETTSKTLEKLSDLERKEKRSQKFSTNLPSETKLDLDSEQMKAIRAKKFGLNSTLSNSDKLAERRDRFGTLDSKI